MTNQALARGRIAALLTASLFLIPLVSAQASEVAPEPPRWAPIANSVITLQGGEKIPASETERTEEQEKLFLDEITILADQGATSAEFESHLGLIDETTGESEKPVEEEFVNDCEKDGVVCPIDPAPLACPRPTGGTSPSNMTIPRPTFQRVQGSTTRYVHATFRYTSPPYINSVGCVVNVGGRDGFGIALNRGVTNLAVSMRHCSHFAGNETNCSQGNLEDNGSTGAGFSFQDKAMGNISGDKITNVERGAIAMRFRSTAPCLQAFSKYGHTWSSTAVNGVGIGPWSVSISWTESTNRWAKSSQSGSTGSC